jgi:hypothetical protein
MPLSPTSVRDDGSLSVSASAAVRSPVLDGVKRTVTVQLC